MNILDGTLRMRILSADLESVLSKFSKSGVELIDISRLDYLTADITIQRHYFSVVKKVADQSGCSIKIFHQTGIGWMIRRLLHRPILLLGFVIFILLLQSISGRILFITVSGNDLVATSEILAQAESCGIEFGIKSAKLRSEEVKNMLLQKIPELQWVGINIKGTVATIQVKERSEAAKTDKANIQPMGIYATSDGVISNITVQRGSALVQVGQQVNSGDLLVSGYTDCGIKIRAEAPEAEIFAYTRKEITVVTPKAIAFRKEIIGQHHCTLIRIGKKVINLCNHSGIQDTTCVKMYEEDYWTLPGGFRLPVSVIRITCLYYETDVKEQDDVSAWLPQYARQFLMKQMIAGEILDEALSWHTFYEMTGTYACHEMIGQVKSEEKLEHNAEDN